MRENQLRIEPLCRMCRQIGETTPADTVDHVVAHRGDRALAFDPANLQSLCKTCHDTHAQRRDRGEAIAGCDDQGFPIDPLHTWNLTKLER